MTLQSPLGVLDVNTLEELSRVISGDDHLYYRKGYEIARFLEHAGWQRVPEYDGEYRREWTLARLTERREDPTELEKVLLRLADPREYFDEPEQLPAVVSAVNAFLVHEGVRLENPGGRPRLVACDPSLAHPGSQGPVELRAAMTDLISDQQMATLLQHRLDEARTCYANGAHVAAMIMLGSLLEGVLVHVVQERDASLLGRTSPDNVTLDTLIKTCHDAGWIGADVQRFCHELRKYRNFVHPRAEIREAHTPDRDTLDMCWPVVNAVLNDLADSQSETA
ncbi:hypothetical protein CG740_16705 [Streptomyces sp. CB01201]|uniref:DUF4145 domain-containing protein n=1 Tax=Streptomyces sp. CB01201 TaxID=2020324 RepID=UPI000C273EAB|nr:DUF4145 domain-containing protein [Streptomyces sp. CB01201]PJN02027.1 hypothetical protein CG740_16705 [Streptomyces sp. CB01201]